MKESPTWVKMLFKRGHGRTCFDSRYAPFRQSFEREHLQNRVAAEVNGAEILREASLAELGGDDPQIVTSALFFLTVVGRQSDVVAVERLVVHPMQLVRKAAKTCCFELSRRDQGPSQ